MLKTHDMLPEKKDALSSSECLNLIAERKTEIEDMRAVPPEIARSGHAVA